MTIEKYLKVNWLILLFCILNRKITFNKNFTRPGFQILQPFYMIETVKKRKNKNT